MAGKRYYWLKLQVGFFQELIIKQLRTLPEGDSIVLLYLKLLLKAINTEGIIYYQYILPTLDEEIALDTGEKPALVKLTISALCQYHAAVFLDDQSLQLLYLEDMVGSESASASRVRNHRANQKLLKEKEQATLGILSMETRGKNSSLFGMSAIFLSISYGVIGSIPRALFVTTLWIWAVAFLVSGLLFVMQIKKLLSKMEKGEVLCTN